jgi:D-sedoheptulose 7-phosphate isomerase
MTSLRPLHTSRAGEPVLQVVPLPARTAPLESPACFSMELSRRAALVSDALRQLRSQSTQLARVTGAVTESLLHGGRILAAGQGDSAATAQHLAAELVRRCPSERAPHAALALIAGSQGSAGDEPDDVFARQIAAYGHRGGVLVMFSTSGSTGSLVRAARAASAVGMTVVAITGPHPNQLATEADLSIAVPAGDAQVVREAHVVVLHLICESVERALVASPVVL